MNGIEGRKKILIIVGVAGLIFLFRYHADHVLALLPFLVLLLCPLMHVFMMKGHGGHGDHRGGCCGMSGGEKRPEDEQGQATKQTDPEDNHKHH